MSILHLYFKSTFPNLFPNLYSLFWNFHYCYKIRQNISFYREDDVSLTILIFWYYYYHWHVHWPLYKHLYIYHLGIHTKDKLITLWMLINKTTFFIFSPLYKLVSKLINLQLLYNQNVVDDSLRFGPCTILQAY